MHIHYYSKREKDKTDLQMRLDMCVGQGQFKKVQKWEEYPVADKHAPIQNTTREKEEEAS